MEVPKSGLKERYTVKDEDWTNKQTSLEFLQNIKGIAPFDKYNYVIFSQDYYCTKSDSVTMHRVQIGFFGEVHY